VVPQHIPHHTKYNVKPKVECEDGTAVIVGLAWLLYELAEFEGMV